MTTLTSKNMWFLVCRVRSYGWSSARRSRTPPAGSVSDSWRSSCSPTQTTRPRGGPPPSNGSGRHSRQDVKITFHFVSSSLAFVPISYPYFLCLYLLFSFSITIFTPPSPHLPSTTTVLLLISYFFASSYNSLYVDPAHPSILTSQVS